MSNHPTGGDTRNELTICYKTDAILTVTPKAVTVVATDKSKCMEINPTLTATATGAVGTDVINYTLATTAVTSNVGNYPIAVTLGTNPTIRLLKLMLF
jgi:hypothetical protein